ncbi:MAG: hypothetical protein WCC92_13645, partial [Candidatus Korobacteraceae bacterium]
IGQCLIDHYQKTYELTYTLWKGRNKTFLILLGAIGVATLVTFPALGTRSLLFLYVRHSLDLKESELGMLQSGFPFGILQAIFLFVIFYLTVNLYHRARYVLRNYAYLGRLEKEIRQQLALPDTSVAFTRESSFYWGSRDRFSAAVKYVYITLLSGLLVSFLAATIIGDLKTGKTLLTVVDIVFAVPTLIFLTAYAIASVSMDGEAAIVPKERGKGKAAQ